MPRILMVLTSHGELGDTGKKTGFWLEEFAAPYYVFRDAGASVTLASPQGGQPPLDPKSDAPDAQTDATRRALSARRATPSTTSGPARVARAPPATTSVSRGAATAARASVTRRRDGDAVTGPPPGDATRTA